MKAKKPAFTLAEIVLAIIIIGLIFSIVSFSLGELRRSARDTKRLSDIEQIQLALEEYYLDEGTYPDLLNFGESLVGSTTDKIYMAKIPQNPQPRSSDCNETEYYYEKDGQNNSYRLNFCLENEKEKSVTGLNCLGPIGEMPCAVTTYTLNYSAGTGGSITGNSSQTIEEGEDGTAVEAQANSGYSFYQWSDNLLTSSRTDTNVQADLNVTALFTANNYTISFDAQGGSVSPSQKEVTYNQQVGSLPTPTRTNYIFQEWNTSSDGSGETYTSTTFYVNNYNITLYALWIFDPCDGMTFITDSRDGNTYQIKAIGNQCWMAENMKYLPSVNLVSCSSTSSSCYYVYDYSGTNVNDAKATYNYQTYGVMYNLYAAMQGPIVSGGQGVCPTGWHVPTHDEWTTLERAVCTSATCTTDFPYDTTTYGIDYRGTDEGSKISSRNDLWNDGILETNPTFSQSGLNLIPGGFRSHSSSSFTLINTDSIFWTSSPISSGAWFRLISYNQTGIRRSYAYSANGDYVRCIKN